MSEAGTEQDREWEPAGNRWLIAVVVTVAAFMEVLDTTIINVALPYIAGTMASSEDEATWALTSYLVANGIVLVVSGHLGRLLGRKRYFLICIVGFTVFSFLCGLAQSLSELVVFRCLQGLFGGGLQPTQQAIILDTFKPTQRAGAFAVTTVATIIAPVLGPTLGGWITDNYSWRWVFLINIPVGIAMFLAVIHLIEDPPWAKAGRRGAIHTDYIGLGFIVLGLGCLQVMLDRGEDDDWFGSPFIRLMALLAAIGLLGGVYWLLYARKPIVDLRVFRDRNFAVGALTLFAMAVVLYGSIVAISQLAQRQYGYTATWAGLVLSPGAAVLLLVIPVVTRLLRYVQIRYVVACGFLCLGLSMVYAHHLSPQIDFETLALIRIAQAASIGMLLAPISTLAYTTLPRELNGDATALFTMLRNLGGSIGISLATTVVIERSQVRQSYLVRDLSPLEQAYDNTLQRVGDTLAATGTAPSDVLQTATGWIYQALLQQAGILAYTDLYALGAILCFVMAPVALLFSPVKADGEVRAGD
ncbi:MAG: DHA2 family efflux MFS transporter permease subunit [Gammaproteobacteria bacterium]